MTRSPLLRVTVSSRHQETEHIVRLDLRPESGQALPAFAPGAQVELHLAPDLVRSYSLVNSSEDEGRYEIAVLRDLNSRGGSRFVHERLRVGSSLDISHPRNHFRLDESAARSVLVAGGIGVTPILAMHDRLLALRKPTAMLYCARSRSVAAYGEWLAASGVVRFHFDDEQKRPPDIREYLSRESKEAHFYCCGPSPMLSAFEKACADLGISNVHVERFAAAALADTSLQHPYRVILARTGRTVDVKPGVPLLDALYEAGVEVDCSCREGICGACATRVLEGVPAHRDSVLTEAERDSNAMMMVCVSGCAGERLVLDL